MNKLFTKIAGAFVGIAMAIGVGAGISFRNSGAREVGAEDKKVTIQQSDAGLFYESSATSTTVHTFSKSSVNFAITGSKTKSSDSATDGYGYIMLMGGQIYNTSAPSDQYVSDVKVTYTNSTGVSGSVVITFGSSALSTRVTTGGTTPTKGGTLEVNNTDKAKAYFNISNTTTSNTQISKIELTWKDSGGGDTPTTYTVTYDGNGNTSGTAPTDSNSPYEDGDNVTVLGPGTLSKTGYMFDGWNTLANGSGTARAAGSSFQMGSANVTLYAQWAVDPNSYATYTPSSRTAVTTTGTAPTNSSAKYNNTYTNTNQITKNNSVTLTLSGYSGCTIKSLVVSMKSNASSGAGSLSLVSNSVTFASISDAAFDNASWNGSYSSDYVNISVAVTSTKIAANKDVVLTIVASTNSLYFGSATIGYLPNVDPVVTIATSSTDLVYDGSNNQTVSFTATPSNFEGTVTYVWTSLSSSVVSATDAGTGANATLKIVGSGTADIKATGTGSNGSATSNVITLIVTAETYSGVLTITSATTANINDGGTISYTLEGNTHEMNVATFTSSDTNVINFANSHNSAFTTGATKGSSATVTVRLTSNVYSLEYYQKTITITLVDPNAVKGVHFTGNITNKTVNFGGNYNLTAVLESDSGNPTDTLVSWESADTSILTVPDNHTNLTCPLTPVKPGQTTVTVTTHDGGFTKTCNVTVTSSSTRVLDSISIITDGDPRTSYYDDETEVDLDNISLSAHFTDPNYSGYSEDVAVDNDADGVVWTLDLENAEVVVTYTVNDVEKSDSLDITVSERPTIAMFDLTSTGYKGSEIASTKGITEGPINIKATATGSYAWRDVNENLRMYSGNEMTITCDNTVESIDLVIITAASGYSCDTEYDYIAYPSESSLEFKSKGIEMPDNTTSFAIKRTGNRCDLVSIEVHYTKVEAKDLDVESVEVTPATITIESGKTYELSVSVLPIDARDLSVTWKSDDESVATVNENGVVTGVAQGSCVITATSNDQDDISDTCEVTVTAGPLFDYSASSAISNSSGSVVKLNNLHYTLTKTGSSYTGFEVNRGAQFSSSKDAVNVQLQSTDIAFATEGLRVVVHAAQNSNGTGTLKAYIGNTQFGGTQNLSTTDTEYTFEYSGTTSSTVSLSDLLKIELNNTGGAVYVKSIKIYSADCKSNIVNFIENSLKMNTYDKGGTQGSTGGNGSCKTWWNDVSSAYNNLSGGQKNLFASEDEYSAARNRLSEWARINNYSYDPLSGILSAGTPRITIFGFGSSSNNLNPVIVVISMISVTAVGGYFFLRKRKED